LNQRNSGSGSQSQFSNQSDQERSTSSSHQNLHPENSELFSDHSGSVSAAELSDMVGLTEEDEDEDDDDEVIEGDAGYLSTSHDGDIEQDLDDEEETMTRLNRRRRIRKDSKASIGGNSRRNVRGGSISTTDKESQDLSDSEINISNNLERQRRSGSSSWSWFSNRNQTTNSSYLKVESRDGNGSFGNTQSQEDSIIYTSGSDVENSNPNPSASDLAFESSLHSNPQAESAGLGLGSRSRNRFINSSSRSCNDTSSLDFGSGGGGLRVPKRRHRRVGLEGDLRSSKRSNTSQSGMSNGRSIDVMRKDKGKGKRVERSHRQVAEREKLKVMDENQTTLQDEEMKSTDASPALTNPSSLSTRNRLIGSLLKKIFDLEPEVLDSFLNQNGADEMFLKGKRMISFGTQGEMDSNGKFEYDYQDFRIREMNKIQELKAEESSKIDDGSSGEETAMEDHSNQNHLSPILQLSKPRSRFSNKSGNSKSDNILSDFQEDTNFSLQENQLDNLNQDSDSLAFSSTVKQLQLQSHQLSNPNTFNSSSSSSTAFEPSAFEALNDVFSNVPLRLLGQLARRIGFGWSIWSNQSARIEDERVTTTVEGENEHFRQTPSRSKASSSRKTQKNRERHLRVGNRLGIQSSGSSS